MPKRQETNGKLDALPDPWPELTEMERECQKAESAYLESKEETRDLKEVFEAKVTELRRRVRAATEPLPLLDGVEVNDDWRSTSIATLGLAAKTVDALATADLTTVGRLADFTARLSDWRFRVHGISKAAAEKVESALEKFLADNPQETATEADKELQPA